MQHKMQRNPERERLINAAHRFAKISRHDPVKLFYLLYMLDIRLYRENGKICTGEFYYAMADGPAPGSLRSLLVMRDLDMHAAIGLLTSTDTIGPWYFDARAFCQCALENLHELETTYRDANSWELRPDDANAWWRVYNKSKGVGAIIPFEMTLCCTHFETVSDKSIDPKKLGQRVHMSDSKQNDYISFNKKREMANKDSFQ
jgi:hypothetical protein